MVEVDIYRRRGVLLIVPCGIEIHDQVVEYRDADTF